MSIVTRIISGGASVAGGAPIYVWIIGALLLALAGEEGLRRIQVSDLEASVANCNAERQRERAEANAAALRQAHEFAEETKRRVLAQKEAEDAHAHVLAIAQRDAAVARNAALGLSRDLAAFTAAAKRAAADPAAVTAGPPAATALDLLADLFSRADGEAGVLAEALDRSHAAGQLCEREYDALSVKP